MKKKLIISIFSVITIMIGVIFGFAETGKIDREKVYKAVDIISDTIETYNMTNEEVKDLPTGEIKEQTEEQEKQTGEEQQVTETEGFLLQGDIAYNGDKEFPSISLGNYQGLTYYSQIDGRWSSHPYTSVGNPNQTIGSSGCGPTSASMVVTAIKGVITPDTMGDLFVNNGFRSADNGTYFSAFRWVADTFNIDYLETYRLDDVVNLLRNNHLVIASCGNGLFTTGGHFIVLVGIDGDTIKIYDPYLYAGKFNTSTRRGKVSVDGYNVYCSIDNFREYANYTKFFAYKNTGAVKPNNDKPVTVDTYTRYVKVNTSLNVRNAPWGTIVGSLSNGTAVTVYEVRDNWSRIGDNRWVCSDYLYSTNTVPSTPSRRGYTTGKYRVNASVLNVRYGAGTNYAAKTWRQLSVNARSQNSRLGNYYTNGYKRGVVCTVTRISGNWGYTPSGWICLDYCSKL